MVFAIIPAAAFARGPASHASNVESGHGASAEGAAHRSAPKAAPEAAKPSRGKGQGNPRSSDVTETPKPHTPRGVEPSGSVDTTFTPRLTGIANALSRLQANLARMQAQLDGGRRAALPGGLVATIAKFISWLGSLEPSTSPVPSSTPTSTPDVH
jgi:hypothetical protein